MDPSDAPLWGQIIASVDWTQVVIVAGTAIMSGLAIYYRAKLREWRASWGAVFAGLRAIPDMQAAIGEVKTKVEGISQFVRPNGGGSLFDGMMRTESAVAALVDQVSIIAGTMRAEDDADVSACRFDCDDSGGNTYVSLPYSVLMECSREELLGWNFLNFVHREDVRQVKELWDECRAQRRTYNNQHRMVSRTGNVLTFKVMAYPVIEGARVKRWIGVMRLIQPAPAPLPKHMRGPDDGN